MKCIGTGLSGLVGSRVVELLPHHTFTNYSLEKGVDITDKASITKHIQEDHESEWVLHMAAYTNVQQAEMDKPLKEQSPAWKVNVEATQYIVDACAASGKKLLYIDTDYAFDGTKDSYTEEDVPHPLGWYAVTKSEGAKRVLTMGENSIVMRISNPYRANPVGKKDFVHKMLEYMTAGKLISAPQDQLFVPTFIDDIAIAIDALLSKNEHGVFHAVGSQVISPFDAALSLARLYGIDTSHITPTTFTAYFEGKAPVPQRAVLINTKIQALGVAMRGFDDGISEMKRQEELSPREISH